MSALNWCGREVDMGAICPTPTKVGHRIAGAIACLHKGNLRLIKVLVFSQGFKATLVGRFQISATNGQRIIVSVEERQVGNLVSTHKPQSFNKPTIIERSFPASSMESHGTSPMAMEPRETGPVPRSHPLKGVWDLWDLGLSVFPSRFRPTLGPNHFLK